MSNRQPNVIWKPGVQRASRPSSRKTVVANPEATNHVGSSTTSTVLKAFNRDNTIPTFIEMPPAPPFLRNAEALGTLWTIKAMVMVRRWSPQTIMALPGFFPNVEPGYQIGDIVIFNGVVKNIERARGGPIEVDRYTFLTTNFENVMFDTSVLTRVK